MLAPLRTFSFPAAVCAGAVALMAWLLCAVQLSPAYGFSRWLTIVRAPLLASAAYVYLVVAFNVAAAPFNWVRVAFVTLWAIFGSLLAIVLSFGLAWAFMLMAKIIPGLAYLPFDLGLMENIIYLFNIVVPVAFLYLVVALAKSYRLQRHE